MVRECQDQGGIPLNRDRVDILKRLKGLTKDEIAELCGESVLFKAEDYSDSKRVSNIRVEDNFLYFSVQGSRPSPYKVEVEYDPKSDEFIPRCSCPSDMAFCKHVIATLLAVQGGSAVKSKRSTVSDEEAEAYLSTLSRDDLINLIRGYFERFQDIRRELSLRAARSRGEKVDIAEYTSEIDDAVSGYVDYDQMVDFIGKLDDIYTSMERLTSIFPEESAEILEHFIKRCIRHYENCDDSDGMYGDFIEKLMELHSTALSRFDCDQKRLAEWIIHQWEHNDYGLGDYILETYASALRVEALNILRDRFSSKLTDVEQRISSKSKWETRYEYSSTKEFLLKVYDLLGDDERFFKLAESGLKDSSDYLLLVEKLVKVGRIDEAIARCEEGIGKRLDEGLLKMLAGLYGDKNNHEKELSVLEKLLRIAPSEEILERIEYLAEKTGKKSEYKKRAVKILNGEKQFELLAKVYMKDKDYEDLIDIALNKGCHRELREKIAGFIAQKFPEEATRIYQDVIPDLISEMENYAYRKAATLLVELRKIHHSQGREQEWTSYIEALKTKHKSKRNLMAELTKASL